VPPIRRRCEGSVVAMTALPRDETPVIVERTGRIATVTINRPHKLNALDTPSNLVLYDSLRELAIDDAVWVVVISGSGDRSFCAGGDLTAVDSSAPHSGRTRISFGGGLTGVGGRRFDMPKPMIAAVNGYAIGGGFELAMACDVVIASNTASFGLTEGRTGWISDSPAVHRAMRQLPYHVAMGLILTGNRMDSDTAHRYGLVNELAPPTELMKVARAWAETMLESSPLALRALKEAAIDGLDIGLSAALERRWETIEEFQTTADRSEGAAAFRQKRKPKWVGR